MPSLTTKSWGLFFVPPIHMADHHWPAP